MKQKSNSNIQGLIDALLTEIYGLHQISSPASSVDFHTNYDNPNAKYSSKTLRSKSIQALTLIYDKLQFKIQNVGLGLIESLLHRDRIRQKREILCSIVTKELKVIAQNCGKTVDMKFSLPPSVPTQGSLSTSMGLSTTASDFTEWLHAMKMVAGLPGGMPPEFRKKLWLALADKNLQTRNIDWSKEQSKCLSDHWRADDEELGVQIVKDLHRTGSSLCTGPMGSINQAKLKRVLLGYARWNPEIGYCQGFNMLGALILQVMDKNEADSIKVMILLIEGVLPQGYFCGSLSGLQADMAVFRELLLTKLPKLAKHLQKLQGSVAEENFEPPLTNVFTMQWFLTLFCTCLPIACVLRVWDLILIEGSDILLRTALIIWSLLEQRILGIKTADDFYCKMGLMSSEILNGNLIDSNSLIERIMDLGPIEDLKKLREKHLYNISPWRDKKGILLFYSDDDGDSDDDSRLAVTKAWGLQGARRDSLGHSSNIKAVIDNKDRLALDISLLKQQYTKLRERQRQAHIILTTACARQGPNTSGPAIQMNQFLMGRNAILSRKGRRIGPPPGSVPPARKPSSVKPTKTTAKPAKPIPETIHWKDTEFDKRRRDSLKWKDIKSERNLDEPTIDDPKSSPTASIKTTSSSRSRKRSESSSYSEDSASNSSTSTSLCDDENQSRRSQSSICGLTEENMKKISPDIEVPEVNKNEEIQKYIDDIKNSFIIKSTDDLLGLNYGEGKSAKQSDDSKVAEDIGYGLPVQDRKEDHVVIPEIKMSIDVSDEACGIDSLEYLPYERLVHDDTSSADLKLDTNKIQQGVAEATSSNQSSCHDSLNINLGIDNAEPTPSCSQDFDIFKPLSYAQIEQNVDAEITSISLARPDYLPSTKHLVADEQLDQITDETDNDAEASVSFDRINFYETLRDNDKNINNSSTKLVKVIGNEDEIGACGLELQCDEKFHDSDELNSNQNIQQNHTTIVPTHDHQNNIKAPQEYLTIDKTLSPQLTNISSISQLSPIPDISQYISMSTISPIPTPSSVIDYSEYISNVSADISPSYARAKNPNNNQSFNVNEDGVTNEFFERINLAERPTRLEISEVYQPAAIRSHAIADVPVTTNSEFVSNFAIGLPISKIKYTTSPMLPSCTDISSISINKSPIMTSISHHILADDPMDVLLKVPERIKFLKEKSVSLDEPTKETESFKPSSCPEIRSESGIGKNSDKVLKIIQENSIILHRILRKNSAKLDDEYIEDFSKIVKATENLLKNKSDDDYCKIVTDDDNDAFTTEDQSPEREFAPFKISDIFANNPLNECILEEQSEETINTENKAIEHSDDKSIHTKPQIISSDVTASESVKRQMPVFSESPKSPRFDHMSKSDNTDFMSSYKFENLPTYKSDSFKVNPIFNKPEDISPPDLSKTLSSIENTIKSINMLCEESEKSKPGYKLDHDSDKSKVRPPSINFEDYSTDQTQYTDHLADNTRALSATRLPRDINRSPSPRRRRQDFIEEFENKSKRVHHATSNLFTTIPTSPQHQHPHHQPHPRPKSDHYEYYNHDYQIPPYRKPPERPEIRHSTVTCTFYDRFLSQKKEKSIRMDKSPSSPVITKSYLESLKPLSDRIIKSAENSPSRSKFEAALVVKPVSILSFERSRGGYVSGGGSDSRDPMMHVKSCDNIVQKVCSEKKTQERTLTDDKISSFSYMPIKKRPTSDIGMKLGLYKASSPVKLSPSS